MFGCALLFAAIAFDSRYRIETSVYELYSSRLPAGFDGFRVVQISDLHGMDFGGTSDSGAGNARLIEAVAEAEPDLIALTGDFVEKAADVEELELLLRELTKLAPCYFVSGNHDWASGAIDELTEMLERCGVRYLRNEYEVLERGGDRIILGGVEDPNGYADQPRPPEFVETVRGSYPEEYMLLLGHRNYWMERYPALDVDTVLCGHAHGGIVRLPFVGAVLGTHFDLFPEHTEGVYRGGRYNLVVSRGLGGSFVPRFNNNAHLPVIVLARDRALQCATDKR